MKQQKTAFITGATGGIGKAAALGLASKHYRVIIHGRNEEKTAAVCKEIKKITGNENIDYFIGDLFLMRDIKKVAETFINKHDRLDILINNAGGIMSKDRKETAEGIEATISVNLLAPFLLTNLLLDLLKRSEDGRIINVSSNSHKLNAKPRLSDIELKHNYNPLVAYGNAKLFLIWISQYLSEQLSSQGLYNVTVNTLHPGAVVTNFGVNSNLGGLLNFFGKLVRPFFKTPEQGAETIIHLAVSDEVKSVNGKYFENKKIKLPSEKYYSKQNEQIIWNYCRTRTENLINKNV
ncbi:SDR family NAD(P)-dependent oxidoreductase [Pedobacter chinensis]|uniref:SDR family NAD(P)-dependent oxidoreductase n=1 Tax=Pedobacter chinensis TaxID=2282421 RepID=A0A369Q0F3_9SPHI|nr:SDR family NAD(P)-dependent oxidoreductase [Pedobacter chinensis]RDC58224.1 SDR family NAD(P)-dependent oxidoreductase [Pedobacter chinensis]